jgi:hypothetical protein
MLYRFRSKSSADVIALPSSGDALLRALGREPQTRGIFEPDALETLIARLEASIAIEEAQRAQAQAKPPGAAPQAQAEGQPQHADVISLKRRAWPLLEMMRRAQREGHPITWG